MTMASILLVEDDEGVRAFVARALSSEGHEVYEAGDGAEALNLLRGPASGCDLVLSDIVMPVMDGIGLALNVARERPDVPILLMTGYANQRERAGDLDEIVRDVVLKPFTLAEIRAKVREVLTAPAVAGEAHCSA
ncbi:response regulator receiver domain-containing protein [Tepidamorphus gemmatus]|uniref:Response regulator receiver domain-containing protein n=2 Tax=Tepidamorphus gemmatus TaxID=747076 RepID=A0A4R3MFG2_9HYPH|nr:response regulator receiver domain-containing protein [Tepidamorphus gemmatus]